MARPTKFKDEYKTLCEKLYKLGLIDEEVADILEVSRQTLYNWQDANPEFFDTIKSAKKFSDDRVVRSLFERANGYSHPEDKIFNNGGEIIVEPTTKHYPPSEAACIFWLKNRDPEKWRDKQEVEHTGDVVTSITKTVIHKKV